MAGAVATEAAEADAEVLTIDVAPTTCVATIRMEDEEATTTEVITMEADVAGIMATRAVMEVNRIIRHRRFQTRGPRQQVVGTFHHRHQAGCHLYRLVDGRVMAGMEVHLWLPRRSVQLGWVTRRRSMEVRHHNSLAIIAR
jgi:hypothetical protein